jgi:hypothetical protein
MSKVNTYIWDSRSNSTIKVVQLALPFSPLELEIDGSFMESFGVPLKDDAWLEMSYWSYCKPTNWFVGLEPEDTETNINAELDGYDLEEIESEFE